MGCARPTVSEQIVQNVAEANGCEPTELPPLYDEIDADALNALVEANFDGEVTFTYAGHTVTVTSGESISLRTQATGDTADRAMSGD